MSAKGWWSLPFGILVLASTARIIMPARDSSRDVRNITVKIAGVAERNGERAGYFRLRRQLSETSRLFETRFGIKFTIRQYQNWAGGRTSRPLVGMLNQLRGTVSKDGCDVVLGVTSDFPLDPVYYGSASYVDGYVLIREMSSDQIMVRTLIHELCHIFGAVDLNASESLMGRDLDGATKLDPFTAGLVEINRDRTFDNHRFPLDSSARRAAIHALEKRDAPGRNEPEAQVMLVQLRIFEGDWKSALRDCEAGLEHWPECPGLHHLRGFILFRQGRHEKAAAEYGLALRTGPSFPEIHHNLALAQLRLGMAGEAELSCLRALDLHPRFAHALVTMSSLKIKKDRFEEAEPLVRQALEIDPEIPEAHNNRGCLLIHRGRIESGIRAFGKALDLDPDYPDARYNLGRALYHRGRLETAVRNLERAVELDPRHLPALSLLALCRLKTGDPAAAEICGRRCLAIRPGHVPALCNLALVFIQTGRLAEARDCCRKAIDQGSGIANVQHITGLLEASEGRHREAARFYRRALRLNPAFHDSALNLAHTCYRLGDIDQAVHYYRKALALRPVNPEVLNNLAVIYFRKGLYQTSRAFLEKAEKQGMTVHPQFRKTLMAKLDGPEDRRRR